MAAQLRELKKQERRKSILENSRTLFRKKGLESVSMEEIAQSLGLSRGTLYNHFVNKDLLVEALLEPFFSYMEKELTFGENKPGYSTLDLADTLYRIYTNQGALWDIIHSPDLANHKTSSELHDTYHHRLKSLATRACSSKGIQASEKLLDMVIAAFPALLGGLGTAEVQRSLFPKAVDALLTLK